MIAKLKGKIDEIKPTELILDVNGVGYEIHIPLSTYEKIQGLDETSLYVYTHHKEDQLKLFGFFTINEKNIFKLLLNISGIGPAMGISILSGISIDLLIEAVRSQNPGMLIKVPGIGKSKAEKLVFELKRKMKNLEIYSDSSTERPTARNEAIEALMSLGFDEAKSSKAVDEIIEKFPDIPLEHIVKNALKNLSS